MRHAGSWRSADLQAPVLGIKVVIPQVRPISIGAAVRAASVSYLVCTQSR